MTVQANTMCVLFVDICDSTRLYHQLGDGAAHSLAANCLKVVAHATARNGGKIVKNIGDGAMVTFSTVEEAYRAAAHIQQAMRSAPLKVKIGFHVGPVIIADGDVFGNTANIAEQVMGRSGPGEILMTRACVDTLSPLQRATVRLIDGPIADGRPETHIYRVLGETGGETTVIPASEQARETERAMVLSFRGDTIRMRASDSGVLIGRDAACRIIIADDCASRQHALIEAQGNSFVVTDRSTNGTYIVDANGREQFLRREAATLSGRGAISIGVSPKQNSGALIKFRIEEDVEPRASGATGAWDSPAPAAIFTATVGAAHASRQFQSWT